MDLLKDTGDTAHPKTQSSKPGLRVEPQPEESNADPSGVSISERSQLRDLDFKDSPDSKINKSSETSDFSSVSLKSEESKGCPPIFSGIEERQTSELQHDTNLDSIFLHLEETMVTFIRDQLKRLHTALVSDHSEGLQSVEEEEEEEQSREAVLNITLDFLKRMDQGHLAECLRNKRDLQISQKLKLSLKNKFSCVYEGITESGKPTSLNEIYTELHITEGEATGINQEHEFRRIETVFRKPAAPETTFTCEDIFKGPHHKPIRTELRYGPIRAERTQGPIRVVLTKGVAGVGKTVLTQKFSLDWAEGRANQDIQLLFTFAFRELNVLRDRQFSLVGLLQHFFSESKALCSLQHLQVVFIFDGLDECQIELDFVNTKIMTDVGMVTTLDLLLVNLIRGSLLPSARLWITTRPAAANQIPAECVSMLTEVQGFSDPQKEQYFRKRFRDEEATAVISHIKKYHSLHIMCHIPVFCWILSSVLQHVMETKTTAQLPQTLTQMYIHFLVVQAKVKNIKYNRNSQSDEYWIPDTKEMVESLGKLAFEQLQKGNLIFYESDLRQCGLEPTEASVYSGVFTQVFREEPGLYQDKVYCFIHLSVQEFLAALHVHQSFVKFGVERVLTELTSESYKSEAAFYRSAVDQALQSPNGHLDLFLRFLLGLSLPANQRLLHGLISDRQHQCVSGSSEAVKYIKQRLSEDLSPEKSINMFHCLIELDDHFLVEEIQQFLKSGRLEADELSPIQWSALVFILRSSNLEEFDLKKYSASEGDFQRLLPVVKASNKAILAGCCLSEMSCSLLAPALSSESSNLRLLDLSNNDLQDRGVELLCSGLNSPLCRLETLRLSGCMVSEVGCTSLATALRDNPSYLSELDLSYNHPGDSVDLLLSLQMDPVSRLHTLRLEPAGVQWLIPGPRKYYIDLELAPDTANKKLHLSADNLTVTHVTKEQPYPVHPERFLTCPQVLCSAGLTGHCYWEVDWSGLVALSVTYRSIKRSGPRGECMFGENSHSWRLWCTSGHFFVAHNAKPTTLHIPPSSSSGRVAVYLDCPAGALSFYKVDNNKLIHLHTFHSTFTEPLFAGFGVWPNGSSVTIRNMKKQT